MQERLKKLEKLEEKPFKETLQSYLKRVEDEFHMALHHLQDVKFKALNEEDKQNAKHYWNKVKDSIDKIQKEYTPEIDRRLE